jgi:hypothetical protein
MLASSARQEEPTFDVIPKDGGTTFLDDHCFKAEGSCDCANRGSHRRWLLSAEDRSERGIILGHVTRNTNFRNS